MKAIVTLVLSFTLSFYLAIAPLYKPGVVASKQPSQPPAATSPARVVATEKCTASWYGDYFHGRTMANGEMFNMHDPRIVAHKTLPKGTHVVITNHTNGKRITAIVKDRGPYKPGRCVDLSFAGAQKLGFVDNGLTRVTVQVVDM